MKEVVRVVLTFIGSFLIVVVMSFLVWFMSTIVRGILEPNVGSILAGVFSFMLCVVVIVKLALDIFNELTRRN